MMHLFALSLILTRCCQLVAFLLLSQLSLGFSLLSGQYRQDMNSQHIFSTTLQHNQFFNHLHCKHLADLGRGTIGRCPGPLFATKDGKKKAKASSQGRGKSLEASADAQTQISVAPKPLRVTNSINIPVKQQIAWAKAYKRLMTSSGFKKSSSAGPPARFKKEKGEKEAAEEYVEVDYFNVKPPAVFVDGYNIIGYINSVEGRSIELSDARDCLISDLSVLKSATGWEIEVVFDAYYVKGPAEQSSNGNIMITYTSSSETADNYIERRFSELEIAGFTNILVATDDIVLRTVAGQARGAGYMTASMLVEELRIAYRGWETLAMETTQTAKRFKPRLGDSVSPEIRAAIDSLRKKSR